MSIHVPIKLTPGAFAPSQSHPSDAGYDLRALFPGTIGPGERQLVNTGLFAAIPEGFVGLIKPRSGLAVRHGIDVLAGVVDSGYRGEVCVVLLNTGRDVPFYFREGDRIAQLVVQRVADVAFEEMDELPPSPRGEGGFGSTGTN